MIFTFYLHVLESAEVTTPKTRVPIEMLEQTSVKQVFSRHGK